MQPSIAVAQLEVKVNTLERLVEESRADRKALHDELAALRESSVRLCTILDSLEKKMCPEPGACITVRKEMEAIKNFHSKLVGGALVLSFIGSVLGVIGGWVLALWFHAHSSSEASSAITGMAATVSTHSTARLAADNHFPHQP